MTSNLSTPPISIIFLDIDGVLNTSFPNEMDDRQQRMISKKLFPHSKYEDLTFEENLLVQSHCFYPLAVMNLCSLISRVKAATFEVKIVLSSNWRHAGNLNYLRTHLFKIHPFAHLIIDTTGKSSSRGVEIYNWLSANSERWNVQNFTILDDEDDWISIFFPDNFIQTSRKKLLTASDTDQAYKAMTNPSPLSTSEKERIKIKSDVLLRISNLQRSIFPFKFTQKPIY